MNWDVITTPVLLLGCACLSLYEGQATGAELHVPAEYATIQLALQASRAGDEIIVAPGTYLGFFEIGGREVTLRSSEGPEVTFLQPLVSGAIMHCVSGEGPNMVIDGFTFRNADSQWGAALYIEDSSPTILNCIFTNNTAQKGGAIYLKNSNSTIANSKFIDNSNLHGFGQDSGGAIYATNSNLSISGCLFQGNVTSGIGGGIYISGTLTIEDSEFYGNSSSRGAGAMITLSGMHVVKNCHFENNTDHVLFLHQDEGGAVINWGGKVTYDNCTFVGNSANRGAVAVDRSGAQVEYLNCVFDGNFTIGNATTPPGNAGAVRVENHGTISTFRDCSFHDNASNGALIAMSNAQHNKEVHIDNCTFQNNMASGVLIYSGTIVDSLFSNNNVGNNVGIAIGGTAGQVTVSNCDILGHSFSGMRILGGAALIENCSFVGNSTSSQEGGGAMYVGNSASIHVTVNDCLFVGNSAKYGGAIRNSGGALEVLSSTFIENHALSEGGAVREMNVPSTYRDCLFQGNTAPSGGAIYGSHSASSLYERCVFDGNSANNGGAVYLQHTNTTTKFIHARFLNNAATATGGAMHSLASPSIFNSLFAFNTAGEVGGAIYATSLSLFQSTVTKNGAPLGGGIRQSSSLFAVKNCIIWDNEGGNFYSPSSQPSVTYSLVGGGFFGVGNIDADPLFVDPANGNFQIAPRSPAIDAGHNNVAFLNEIVVDLLGEPRLSDGGGGDGCGAVAIVDMGAYEYQGVPHSVKYGDLTGDGIVNGFDLLLLLSAWGDIQSYCLADLNMDGIVNGLDLVILLSNWG